MHKIIFFPDSFFKKCVPTSLKFLDPFTDEHLLFSFYSALSYIRFGSGFEADSMHGLI